METKGNREKRETKGIEKKSVTLRQIKRASLQRIISLPATRVQEGSVGVNQR
jgi:hypothetical protein